MPGLTRRRFLVGAATAGLALASGGLVASCQRTALGTVEYACDAIFQSDYLEPFEMPVT